jgi:hypothetical protein
MPLRPTVSLIALGLTCAGCAKEVPPTPTHLSPDHVMRMASPEVVPPVRKPPVKQPDEVTLADNSPVVGVVAGGKPRAYSLKALAAGDGHVVNDLLDDVPVSVVFCDFKRAVRVFTADSRGQPLDLAQVGHSREGLLIRYNGRIYLHQTGKPVSGDGPDLPLKHHAFEETTWKAWREKHAGTEVYVGPDALPLGPDKP